MSKHALVLFAKEPVPGRVKSRLLPHLAPEDAADLYRAFVEDLVESLCNLPSIDLYVACYPTDQHPHFQMLSKHYPLTLLVQQGHDLGERMEQTFRHLAAQGFRRRIIIGTDSPTLPLTIIQEAFRQLEDHNLVLGPSHDGGYYLIGLSSEDPAVPGRARGVGASERSARAPISKGKIPPIFNGIPWGTQQVLTQTLQRINESAIPMYLLPFWYDVDTFEDLSFLKEHLSHLSKAGHPIPKRTHFYLNAQLNKEQPHA